MCLAGLAYIEYADTKLIINSFQRHGKSNINIQPWVDKKHFAVTKMLGEISFFDGDLGTDKEFLEYEIMDLGVELLN